MILLPPPQRYALRANNIAHRAVEAAGHPEPNPASIVKFFNPIGAATWLASELGPDDVAGRHVTPCNLFGLADLGFGCPELSYFSLRKTAGVHLPFGLTIERHLDFTSLYALTIWAEIAHREGSIREAEILLGPS